MKPNEHAYGVTVPVSVTPVLSTAGAYTSGDYVGTSASPMTFAGAARDVGGSGLIVNAILIDAAVQSVAAELWLFTSDPTPPADNAAWTISDANAKNCIGVIPFATYYASALNSVCPSVLTAIPYTCASGSTSLYGCLVTRGTPTYTSGDLTVILRMLLD